MRKLIMFNLVSLDGLFAGPSGEIDWHNVDDEFNEFALAQLDSAHGLLFGRVTYQLMASYWPTPDAAAQAPAIASSMNSISKTVFSKTLASADWANTRLIKDDVQQEIFNLKQEPGRELLLLGSADLASSLTKLRLIDEYRIMVNPVVLGEGQPLFKNVHQKLALKLSSTRTFRSGNVLLGYELA
jgi:dihydrofolate reductase